MAGQEVGVAGRQVVTEPPQAPSWNQAGVTRARERASRQDGTYGATRASRPTARSRGGGRFGVPLARRGEEDAGYRVRSGTAQDVLDIYEARIALEAEAAGAAAARRTDLELASRASGGYRPPCKRTVSGLNPLTGSQYL